MLSVEHSLLLLERLLDFSLPVQLLSLLYAIPMVWSIAQVIYYAFEKAFWLGLFMLVFSPLSAFFYVAMGMVVSAIEAREMLAILISYQDPLTIGLVLSWGAWFLVAWNKAPVFWEPLVRMFCLSALYFLALVLMQQFPLFSEPQVVAAGSAAALPSR